VAGGNTITVEVTAPDALTKSTYTVAVTRAAYDVSLTSLTLSDGTLAPAFDGDVLSYTATVAAATDQLTLTPTPADPTASVTINDLAPAPVALAVGSNSIAVKVTAPDGLTSRTYTLVVTREMPAPTITAHPVDAAVEEGQLVSFAVTATSDGPMAYQWQRSDDGVTWGDINEAAASSHTITAALSDDGAQFRCRISNAGGTSTSNAATLTVNLLPPHIAAHPRDAVVHGGSPSTFALTATSSAPMTWQWQRSDDSGASWSDILALDATADSYTIPVTVPADDGAQFRCQVANAGGTALSNAATLTVTPAPYLIIDLPTGGASYADSIPDLLTNDAYKTTKVVLKWISPGTFEMGDQVGDGYASELPVHTVNLTQGYYLGVFEVTQRQWFEVQGDWPSHFTTTPDKRPVEQVSWNDIKGASGFMATLSGATSLTCRLPTEAEWEYACKAGTSTSWSYGSSEDGAYMWYDSNAGGETHEVGTCAPNPWGLYDMHGNVFEWCEDYYADDYYESSPTDDPTGPTGGATRVLRGGSWSGIAWVCRSAVRGRISPDFRGSDNGFRVAVSSAAGP
jgi:formylglycine-generating enzyme required for sulfatase activity